MRHVGPGDGGGRLVALDLMLMFGVLLVVGLARPFCVLATAALLAAVFFAVTRRRARLKALGLALLVGLVWAAVVNTRYDYAHATPVVLGANLYAALAWGLSLFATYFLHDHLARWLGIHGPTARLVTYTLLYWTALLFCEYFAYHVHGIRNVPTSDYAGLPGIDCLHAPRWMQVTYFVIGPAYLLVVSRLAPLPSRGRSIAARGPEDVGLLPATPEEPRAR